MLHSAVIFLPSSVPSKTHDFSFITSSIIYSNYHRLPSTSCIIVKFLLFYVKCVGTYIQNYVGRSYSAPYPEVGSDFRCVVDWGWWKFLIIGFIVDSFFIAISVVSFAASRSHWFPYEYHLLSTDYALGSRLVLASCLTFPHFTEA